MKYNYKDGHQMVTEHHQYIECDIIGLSQFLIFAYAKSLAHRNTGTDLQTRKHNSSPKEYLQFAKILGKHGKNTCIIILKYQNVNHALFSTFCIFLV